MFHITRLSFMVYFYLPFVLCVLCLDKKTLRQLAEGFLYVLSIRLRDRFRDRLDFLYQGIVQDGIHNLLKS